MSDSSGTPEVYVHPEIDPWFDQLAELSQVGVVMIDKDRQIQLVNRVARQILECEEEASLSDCVREIREHLEKLFELSERNQDEVQETEVEINCSDGVHVIGLSGHAINLENCVGVLVLIQDRQIEELMAQDFRLASKYRNLSRLYQSLAHDLQSPVAALRAYRELLQSRLDRDLGRKRVRDGYLECLNGIDQCSETLRQSLNLLLTDLSERETELLETIDLRNTVLEVTQLTAPRAQAQDVALSFESPAEPVFVRAEPLRLRLALVNLTANALEATEQGAQVKLSLRRTQSEAEIQVQDNGCGIPKANLGRVFERYFTTKSSGSGIGLHIVQSIIQGHHGSIQIDSQEGEGTTVLIQLPLTNDQNQAKS